MILYRKIDVVTYSHRGDDLSNGKNGFEFYLFEMFGAFIYVGTWLFEMCMFCSLLYYSYLKVEITLFPPLINKQLKLV